MKRARRSGAIARLEEVGPASWAQGKQAEVAPALSLPPQGMSLDCVEVSLGRVFASGQAYFPGPAACRAFACWTLTPWWFAVTPVF